MAGIYDDIRCLKKRKNVFNPTEYQSEVVNYFVNVSNYKGLLLYHKLGAGKTCTSVLIADQMLRLKKIKKVYVLTPGSLRVNWIDEYCKKCGDKYISKHFIFMTYNSDLKRKLDNFNFDNSLIIIDEAHNIINGVRNLSDNAIQIYKKIYESNSRVLLLTGTPIIQYIHEWSIMGNLLNPGSFKNILVYDKHKPYIVGDAFIPTNENKEYQGIVSYYPGNKDLYPTTIYRRPIKCRMSKKQTNSHIEILDYEKIKIAQGLPTLRDPNYAIQYMNFIRCVKRIPSRKISNLNYDHRIIADYSNIINSINYMDLLKDKYIKERNEAEGHSEFELINKVYSIQLEIVDIVKGSYISKRDKIRLGGRSIMKKKHEIDLMIKKKETQRDAHLNQLKSQGVILAFPKYIQNLDDPTILKQLKIVGTNQDGEDGEGDDKKELEEEDEYSNYNTSWIDDGLINVYPNLLFEASPKYVALLTNIVSRLKTKHVVFSFFKTGIGIETISKLLGRCGITYGIFSGDIDDRERRRIVNLFNSVENRNGELMNVLFITEAGAEGISLLEVNNMHIVESSTREHKITQAIGRVARIYSHVNMPKDRQYVNVWRYWSVPSQDYGVDPNAKNAIVNSPTICIDEKLYNQGQMYEEGKNVFINKLIQNSIENIVPDPEDMPKVKNFAYKLHSMSDKFYEVVDKSITDIRFDNPNTYVFLPFTTSSTKMPQESKNFLSRFPNLERMSGYYRVPHQNTQWATIQTRNDPGTYIIVKNKNINAIFAFIQQTLRVPKNIIDPLEPDLEPEKYRDRFINIDRILRELSETLPAGSTICIPSSIGTNGEAKFMLVVHDIISSVGKANTSIKFKLYLR